MKKFSLFFAFVAIFATLNSCGLISEKVEPNYAQSSEYFAFPDGFKVVDENGKSISAIKVTDYPYSLMTNGQSQETHTSSRVTPDEYGQLQQISSHGLYFVNSKGQKIKIKMYVAKNQVASGSIGFYPKNFITGKSFIALYYPYTRTFSRWQQDPLFSDIRSYLQYSTNGQKFELNTSLQEYKIETEVSWIACVTGTETSPTISIMK